MTIDARQIGRELVVVVHGSFERRDTAEVEAAVAGSGPATRVTIDMRDARFCDDFAIATLARAFSGDAAADVELVGLSDHHRRLLRYLGIPTTRH